MVRLVTYSPYSVIVENPLLLYSKGFFFSLDNTHNEISLDSKCEYHDLRLMKNENSCSYKICC